MTQVCLCSSNDFFFQMNCLFFLLLFYAKKTTCTYVKDDFFLKSAVCLQVRAARSLLSAVTRLLILADIIDVNLLLKKLQRVENDLENLKNVNSQAELMDSMGRFTHSAQELMAQAAKR